ncbi:MAG: DUF1015 domain-containing protein [Clostridiales bacterium]|nr:DUF1015 domain-containing protein [Clostridiales bacterium]
MAVIKPFKSIRPCRDEAARIAALPYDVYNREEAKSEVEREPMSFLRIDRAETNFPGSVDIYDPRVYEKAHDILWDMVKRGDFITEEVPCYYIYELTMDGRSQTGIAACASIDDYANGVIKKHENTRAEKEVDRINHVDACDAQTGPIFLAYRADETICGIVNKVKTGEPEYDFTSPDGVTHRVWVISDGQDIADIQAAFAGIDSIYIADGHHRAASAVKVGLKRREAHPDYDGTEEFNYFLSVLFPDEELKIMDYNRVVKDLNGLAPEDLLAKVEDIFEVTPIDAAGNCGNKGFAKIKVGDDNGMDLVTDSGTDPRKPAEKGSFSMYLDRKWYLCRIRKEDRPDDPVAGLDVSLLQNLLLNPVLGIEDPKTDPRIGFVGGIRGMDELERRCHTDSAVAFAMYPTSIAELFAVADAGLLMPPKSTWFEPKLRSGLFIHKLS